MQYSTHARMKITGPDAFSEKHFINKASSFHEYFVRFSIERNKLFYHRWNVGFYFLCFY